MTTTLAVLGSTGSIGTQTLDIVRAAPERSEVVALGAATSVKELAAQANEFRPRVVAIADSAASPNCKSSFPQARRATVPDALADAAREVQRSSTVSSARGPRTWPPSGRPAAGSGPQESYLCLPFVARVRTTPGARVAAT